MQTMFFFRMLVV